MSLKEGENERTAEPAQRNIVAEARYYVRPDGSCPFKEWRDSVKDRKVGNRIDRRIRRAENGNFGKHRTEGALVEMKFPTAHRVYCGRDGNELIILLVGGSDKKKKAQNEDFETARELWEEYLSSKRK